MATKENLSIKRIQISKANARMVAFIAGASALVVFSLMSSRALLSQRSYQNRVIAEKTKARNQLKENTKAVKNLIVDYSAFVGASENVLGGNPKGNGDKDGDNAKIVLDALPSKYDFPALATSLEKLLGSGNYKINSITGTDDEVQQQNTANPSPTPIEIPFEISISGNYSSIQDAINSLEKSIRPMQIQSIKLDGADTSLQMTISAKTFYQPEKTLQATTKEVK